VENLLKKLSSLFLFGLILLAPGVARADADTAPPVTTHGHRKSANKDKDVVLAKISGHCTVVASPGNPFEGPCISTWLELKDSSGTEQSRVQTTPAGDFEFDLEETSEKFQLLLVSHLYKLISPTAPVRVGDRVDLRIQQN
jgi:hypothetical protein